MSVCRPIVFLYFVVKIRKIQHVFWLKYFKYILRQYFDRYFNYIVQSIFHFTSVPSAAPPFPQIDIIRAVVIVWRVRGKTIRSVLCNVVCNNCAQCDAHTLWTDLTVLWIGFCLTGPISLCLVSFLYCVLLCVVCVLRFVTRWGGPGGIEACP